MRTKAAGACAVAGMLATGLSGCGRGAEPRWIPIASAFARVPAPAGFSSQTGTLEADVRLSLEGVDATLTLALPRAAWQPGARAGLWRVKPAILLPLDEASLALRTPAGPGHLVRHGGLRDPMSFEWRKGELAAVLGAEAPEQATLSCRLLPPAPGEHVGRNGFTSAGVVLLSGQSVRAQVDLPATSALRFGAALEPLVEGLQPGPVRLRVLLDGAVLAEPALLEPGLAGLTWHELPLPDGVRAGARLELEASGGLARVLILDPVLGPRQNGRSHAAPGADARPDLVLFLADTFRADNLALYGGRDGATPNLDRLAESGLGFLQARSTATWTLPAHASLFTGLYPPRLPGCTTWPRAAGLAEDFDTLAERLSRAGYRTGAITDGAIVSGAYGLDQGFEFFVECDSLAKDLDLSLRAAHAFLEAEDGRPTFLFVQTYRAHWPYAGTADGPPRDDVEKLLEAVIEEAHAHGFDTMADGVPDTPRMQEVALELRARYLEGVRALDRSAGPFLARLEESGFLEHGYLVFTSDHGESFAENGLMFHQTELYEVLVRVPLLILGRGLPARRVEDPVSLVDLAPTLAAMAGIPGDPAWPGRSLLTHAAPSDRRERTLFGFHTSSKESSLFALEGHRKILLPKDGVASGARLRAFDLAEDPHEANDVAESAEWARALLRENAAFLDALLTSPAEAGEGAIDADRAAELKRLGY